MYNPGIRMLRLLITLLLCGLLPRLWAQRDSDDERSFVAKTVSRPSTGGFGIADKFDKPCSVRLQNCSLDDKKIRGFRSRNHYDVYLENHQSDDLRNAYEVWNSENVFAPNAKSRFQRLSNRKTEISVGKKAQYTKAVDTEEDKPYVLDDDYSLVNYVDNWKSLDHSMKKCRMTSFSSRKSLDVGEKRGKRESEDKEFKMEFHSLRGNSEFKSQVPHGYELLNDGGRRSSTNRRNIKASNLLRKPPNYEHLEARGKGNCQHTAKYKKKYSSCRKKQVLWGRKRGKQYPKLGTKSGFLEDFEARFNEREKPKYNVSAPKSNLVGAGSGWHWATTGSYAIDAVTPPRDLVKPQPELGILPQVLIPLINMTEPLMISKPFQANLNPLLRQTSGVNLKNIAGPSYVKGNQRVVIPSGEPKLALKPLERNIAKPNPRTAYRLSPFDINSPTKNVYNLFEQKHIPLWNIRQRSPQATSFFENSIRLSHLPRLKMAPNENIHFVQPWSLRSVQHESEEATGESSYLFNSTKLSRAVYATNEYHPLQGPSTPKVFDTADIVSFLQSALLPQKAINSVEPGFASTPKATEQTMLLNSIPIESVLDIISPAKCKSSPQPEDAATAAADTTPDDLNVIVDATKEALLSLFTSEDPLIDSLEDIIRRNTDRKIPIVYDIEDAPQLSNTNGSELTVNPVKRLSKSVQNETLVEWKSHFLDRRGILNKNRSASKIGNPITNATLTTPWIVLATTENMLYSEMLAQQKSQMNVSRKSKARKSNPKTKINLLFKSKLKSNESATETLTSTARLIAKIKRDKKAAISRAPKGSSFKKSVAFPKKPCRKCTCHCHTTTPSSSCCQCRSQEALELTTLPSCQPAYIAEGSISCPDCHQEFTYKLGLAPLTNL